jgi:MFS family permease
MQHKLSMPTLLLLISFASVNAVLFTPAMPSIAHFFNVSTSATQSTITWFLIGYALGQLLYGPIANRFGRKPALYVGISIQILSSVLCVAAGWVHDFELLIVGRFLLALGAGVGLKITFTLVNECYEPKMASQKISYLMLAFALTPGLGIALGGLLNTYYGWMSCFYAGVVYGVILLLLVTRLPETLPTPDLQALQWHHLIHGYKSQFINRRLIVGGLLMGSGTSFIYIFAAIGPFIAINLLGMSSAEYGLANILPPIGLALGSLVNAQLSKKYELKILLRTGIMITGLGVLLMLSAILFHSNAWLALFVPTIVIYFGLCFIMPNASALSMSSTADKAHGSAVMNFVNMGTATLGVLLVGLFSVHVLLLPLIYFAALAVMLSSSRWATQK